MEGCTQELRGGLRCSDLYRTLTDPYEALTRAWNTEPSKMRLTLWEEQLLDRVATHWCRMRIETAHPCPRPVTTEIWGVCFGESCAHEQGAYFVIGELTQELTAVRTKRPRGARRGRLAGALYRLRTNLGGHAAVKRA